MANQSARQQSVSAFDLGFASRQHQSYGYAHQPRLPLQQQQQSQEPLQRVQLGVLSASQSNRGRVLQPVRSPSAARAASYGGRGGNAGSAAVFYGDGYGYGYQRQTQQQQQVRFLQGEERKEQAERPLLGSQSLRISEEERRLSAALIHEAENVSPQARAFLAHQSRQREAQRRRREHQRLKQVYEYREPLPQVGAAAGAPGALPLQARVQQQREHHLHLQRPVPQAHESHSYHQQQHELEGQRNPELSLLSQESSSTVRSSQEPFPQEEPEEEREEEQEHMAPQDEYVVFLDWDNTLLCSDWLQQRGQDIGASPLDRATRKELQALERRAVRIVEFFKRRFGNDRVFIVTLAEKGWVERSAMKFLPGLVPSLKPLHIVSARSLFEHVLPNQPFVWKHRAMRRLLAQALQAPLPHLEPATLRQLVRLHMQAPAVQEARRQQFLLSHQGPHLQQQQRSQSAPADARRRSSPPQEPWLDEVTFAERIDGDGPLLHVISVGDSWVERSAAMVFKDIVQGAVVKTVKFLEQPSLADVAGQLAELEARLPQLVAHRGSLDLFVKRDAAGGVFL